MADLADQAAEHDFVDEAIQRHQNTKKPTVIRGSCLNCGTHIALTKIYCDLDCKSDHEYRKAVRQNQGLK